MSVQNTARHSSTDKFTTPDLEPEFDLGDDPGISLEKMS